MTSQLNDSPLSNSPIRFGNENQLLSQLFEQSVEDVSSEWSPLLLYGDSGSGKSFTALALADRWNEFYDIASALVTTAPDLCRLFTPTQVSNGDWAAAYRDAPLLVIDDLQYLAQKDLASDWLATVIDYRNQFCLPSIFTIQSVDELSKISRRLSSRLLGGLSLRLSLPNEQTRSKLILEFAADPALSVDSKVLNQMIAQTNGMSVTGIRNAVQSVGNQLVVSADESTSKHTTLPAAKEELAAICIRASARRFGVRVADLKSASRRKNTVLARSIAMFLIRQLGSFSLAEVGQFFQNRDHTTVRHACRKIQQSLSNDRATQDAVRSICASLKVPVSPAWFEYQAEESA